MKIIVVALLAVLVLGSVGSTAAGAPTPDPLDSGTSASTDTSTPDPDPGDSGPVGVWLTLANGRGTDSRDTGSVFEPKEVRWIFVLRGAPVDTEFTVWAECASAGEIEMIGVDQVAVVTPGHDVLVDAHAHLILPSDGLIESVSLELLTVEVVASVPTTVTPPAPNLTPETLLSETPPAPSDADEPFLPFTESVRNRPAGEPFLPFTGTNEKLPLLAALFGVLGWVLRRAATAS